MKKYAVIGDPIKHSLSPVMHNAGFNALGLDAQYETIHVEETNIAEFAEFARKELSGFNVTVPHKQNIIPFLDEISRTAELAQSINTVSIENGKMIGTTTDGYGLEMGIKEAFDIDIQNTNFTFIGCGGAVQAVAYHFAGQGAKSLRFINRTVSKAENLADKLSNAFSGLTLGVSPMDDDKKIKSFFADTAVLIQGTSLGLNPSDPSPIKKELLTDNLSIYDTIYKKTAFLRNAQELGLKTGDGRSMLLYQGAKAFSIWTKTDAPVQEMKKALYEKMG